MKIEKLKSFRLLNMYEKLNRGDVINKKAFAREFGISEKSVQRDIDDLRAYLAESCDNGDSATVEYDYDKNGYKLVREEREFLTNKEIFAVAKVLLESRGFNKIEMNNILDKLMLQATPTARMNIKELILNERFHYIPPRHGKPVIEALWELNEHIFNKEIIEFNYIRKDGVGSHKRVKPLAVMFSDYYFYLIGWMADGSKDYPTVFRIDRMTEIFSTGTKYKIPYTERFEEGEFREKV